MESRGKQPRLLARSLNWTLADALALSDPDGPALVHPEVLDLDAIGVNAPKFAQTPTAKAGMWHRINELIKKMGLPKAGMLFRINKSLKVAAVKFEMLLITKELIV